MTAPTNLLFYLIISASRQNQIILARMTRPHPPHPTSTSTKYHPSLHLGSIRNEEKKVHFIFPSCNQTIASPSDRWKTQWITVNCKLWTPPTLISALFGFPPLHQPFACLRQGRLGLEGCIATSSLPELVLMLRWEGRIVTFSLPELVTIFIYQRKLEGWKSLPDNKETRKNKYE